MNTSTNVKITAGKKRLPGFWMVPPEPRGVVVFAHGSGSSRHSSRNQYVASVLQETGFATLLLDLLTETESNNRAKVFDIDLLGERLLAAIDWIARRPEALDLPIGLFGASTGAAAALRAAALRPDAIRAVVSRGGRPDLAMHDLPNVHAATLLIVGGNDDEVLQLNRAARRRLAGESELQVIPGATHLFEEAGALPRVAELAAEWFATRLVDPVPSEIRMPRGFADRAEAGRLLADRLRRRRFANPLVLAIPRGGVVLGAVLAKALHAELDVVLSRKLPMPGNPEFALGAISEGGEVHLNVEAEDLPPRFEDYLREACARQTEEIARRRQLFRANRPPAAVADRSVIVVDDGIATGSTMIAALHTLRLGKPRELIVAVPVAAPDRLAQIRKECDEVVCLIEAPNLLAVGQFYQDFTQVEDEEVVAMLNQNLSKHPKGG